MLSRGAILRYHIVKNRYLTILRNDRGRDYRRNLVDLTRYEIRGPSLLELNEEDGLLYCATVLIDKQTRRIEDEVVVGYVDAKWRLVF